MKFPGKVSYSSKSTFGFCPYQYYRKYFSGEFYWISSLGVNEINYNLDFGSLVHDAIYTAITLGTIDEDKVFKIACDMAEIRLARYKYDNLINPDFWKDDLRKELNQMITFLNSIDLFDREFGVEEKFETEIEIKYDEDGEEKTHVQTIIGFMDLWYRDFDDVVVVDWKTGKPQSQLKVDQMEQLTMYTWLVEDNSEKFDWSVDCIVPAIFYTKTGRFIKSKFRKESEIDKLIDEIETMLLTTDFEPKERPPRFICKNCIGNYNCVFLKGYLRESRPKLF